MKVSNCKKCKYYQRKVWSTYYKPGNYHAIGVSHAYGYCTRYKCRCLDVNKCEAENEN